MPNNSTEPTAPIAQELSNPVQLRAEWKTQEQPDATAGLSSLKQRVPAIDKSTNPTAQESEGPIAEKRATVRPGAKRKTDDFESFSAVLSLVGYLCLLRHDKA